MSTALEQAERAYVEQTAVADLAWLEWCRTALVNGVRCDVDPQSFKSVLWLIEVDNGVRVIRQPMEIER